MSQGLLRTWRATRIHVQKTERAQRGEETLKDDRPAAQETSPRSRHELVAESSPWIPKMLADSKNKRVSLATPCVWAGVRIRTLGAASALLRWEELEAVLGVDVIEIRVHVRPSNDQETTIEDTD